MQRERRPARRAELPESEVRLLRELSRNDVRARVRELYVAGWSLSSIAEAFDPPRARTSIRAWTRSTRPPHTQLPSVPSPPSSSSSPSSSADSLIGTAESFASSSSSAADTLRDYRVLDRAHSVITEDERSRIRELAPLARRYRARTDARGPYGAANDELTALAKELYDRGAPVRELAEAAGVTYRAMARRLGR